MVRTVVSATAATITISPGRPLGSGGSFSLMPPDPK